MTPEIEGLVELLKIGGVSGLALGGVIYLLVLRAKSPEKTPMDMLREQVTEAHKEVVEVRADMEQFRLEMHGRLTVVETKLGAKVR